MEQVKQNAKSKKQTKQPIQKEVVSQDTKVEKAPTIFETNKFMRVFKWFIPTLVVFVVLMINYAVKGIAPFGSKYISYIDMEVGYVPVYYSLWDAVRGGGNFFYNFFLGAGSNVYGSLVSNAFYSPLTWLIIMVPRGSISAFLSWYLIIKLSLMATTMYYFIRKVFTNTSPYIQLLYSILWAFSGFVMVHFTNIIWLDNMILFPFVCLGIRRIINDNKMDLFVTTLTFCLLFSFYISFMMLLMIIFCGGTVIYFSDKTKEEKKKIVTKLVIGTFAALFISFVSFLPAFWQSWTSHRISNAKTDILYQNTWSKAVTILMNFFTIFGFAKLITKYKEDKKNILMFIVMVGFTTITILLERANMLWHTGSYQSFPYRFSFIPIFIMMCGGLYYFNSHFKYEKEVKKFDYTTIALLVPIVIGCVVIASSMQYPAFTLGVESFLLFGIIATLIVFCLFRVFARNNRKVNFIMVSILCSVEVISGAFGYIGQWTDNDVNIAANKYNAFYENLEFVDDDYRVATMYTSEDNFYMAKYYNYPYIIRKQSLSTWLHIIGSDQVLNAEQLGYVTKGTVITSSGGNYFTNMANNVRYVIADTELNSRVYTLIDSYEGYNLYSYNFYLPYAGVFATEDMIESIPEEYQNFAASNYLYNNVYNKTGDLFTTLTATKTDVDENTVKFEIQTTADTLIYLNSPKYCDDIMTYKLNDKEVLLYSDTQELGYFNGEIITITIDKAHEEYYKDFTFASIDVSKLEDLMNSNSIKEVDELKFDGASIKATVNSAVAGESLYIPFNFDAGWKATVNGKEVTIDKTLNAYMSVKLEEGDNKVEFTFTPPMFNIGLIVSLVFLVLTLAGWAITKFTKFKFMENRILNNIFFWVGIVGFCIAGAIIYVRPLIQTIIYLG